jgi:hypothetical protein
MNDVAQVKELDGRMNEVVQARAHGDHIASGGQVRVHDNHTREEALAKALGDRESAEVQVMGLVQLHGCWV